MKLKWQFWKTVLIRFSHQEGAHSNQLIPLCVHVNSQICILLYHKDTGWSWIAWHCKIKIEHVVHDCSRSTVWYCLIIIYSAIFYNRSIKTSLYHFFGGKKWTRKKTHAKVQNVRSVRKTYNVRGIGGNVRFCEKKIPQKSDMLTKINRSRSLPRT